MAITMQLMQLMHFTHTTTPPKTTAWEANNADSHAYSDLGGNWAEPWRCKAGGEWRFFEEETGVGLDDECGVAILDDNINLELPVRPCCTTYGVRRTG